MFTLFPRRRKEVRHPHPGYRRRLVAALSSGALALSSVALIAPSASAAPYCGITWGSTNKVDLTNSTGQVTNVRTGRHTCFDRLVLDLSGDARGYSVRYTSPVRNANTGAVVPLRGGASLEVVSTAPAIATDAWFLPSGDIANVSNYQTFRQVKFAGSTVGRGYPGHTTIALGVRARLPYRVVLVDGPGNGSRMVVDVAHKW